MGVWGEASEATGPVCPGCGARRAPEEERCPACGLGVARREEPHVRTSDLEPYTALLYIGRLFKVLSVLILVALTGELVLGVILEGVSGLGTFLGEAMRLLALAGLLWAGGDIVRLMIDAGHDLRMSRILLGRISTRFQRPSAPSAPASTQRDGRRAS
jgi:hypothetical protein